MDTTIFYALNSLAGRSVVADAVFIFLASWLIWIQAVAVLVFWLLSRARRLVPIISAALGAGLVWVINQFIGEIIFLPRPFASLSNVHQLISKSALEKSFPSDHAALVFAIATSIFLVDRRWGSAFLIIAALVSIGRVLAGVHFPSDVLVGAALGAACAVLAHYLIHHFLHTRHRRP